MSYTYKEMVESRRPAPHKTIKITQSHIDHAIRNNSRTCAIAAAMAEAGALRPIIHRGRVSFTMNRERFTYVVEPNMAAFILDFDRGGPAAVKPVTLRLRDGLVHKCYTSGGPDRTHKATTRKDRRAGNRVPSRLVTSTRMDGFVVARKR